MKTSEKITTIAPALCKAQAAIKAATKDATNPHFRSKYADLTSVIDACKAALNAAGITFLQPVRAGESGVVVETVLLHTSGEWISDELELPVSKNDAQGVGSAITYGRRYGLQSMVGIPAEDDDGNAAVKAPNASSAAADKIISANKERPSHPTQVMHDALAAMDIDEQNRMRDIAVMITDAFGESDGGAARSVLVGFDLDHEQQLAVGGLLTTKIRNAIKAARTNSELATQP
jgi:hypothetical protein